MTSAMDYDVTTSSLLTAATTLLSNTSTDVTVEVDEGCGARFRFVFLALVCSVVCVLGLVGNTLSFVVYQADGSSPMASLLLQALALADNTFLLLWFVHYSVREYVIAAGLDMWYMTVLRAYTFPILYMAQMQTIWLTVVIAMNRYFAVCMPYQASTLCTMANIYKQLVGVTIFSVLYNIPRFFEIKVVHGNEFFERTALGKNMYYAIIYTDVLYYGFTFVLPLATLAVVNTSVMCAYSRLRQRRARLTSRPTRNDNNITLIMILVVLVFMLCQAPARIVQMVWSYEYEHCRQLQFYLIYVSNLLELLNSSLNFVVYVTFRKRFASILLSQVCDRTHLLRRNAPSTRSITTEGLALTEHGRTSSCTARRSTRESAMEGDDQPSYSVPPEEYQQHGGEVRLANGGVRDEIAKCDSIRSLNEHVDIESAPLTT